MRRAVAVSLVSTWLLCCVGEPGGAADLPAVGAAAGDRFDAVVIDAGHGGEDEGARGPGGLLEKELVLDIARRLEKRLRTRGVEVVMTRDRDVFVPLETRTMVANDAGADLFVSIHANAARSRSPRGIEVYFASLDATDANAQAVADLENSAFGAAAAAPTGDDPLLAIIGDMIAADTMRDSSAFAQLAQRRLDAIDATPSRGVKLAPFVVLLGVQAPAALVEIGFLSNPSEEKVLRRRDRRDAIALALEEAVLAYGRRYDALRGVSAAPR